MTGECTAYLQHMLNGLAGAPPVNHLADYTIFIHDDAPRHLKPDFLSIIFRSMAMGSFDADYLNIAHERYVSASTPCLKRLYKMVFGTELEGRLSTYCCGHFVVSAKRLRSLPLEHLQNLLNAVMTGAYTALAGGPCEVTGLSKVYPSIHVALVSSSYVLLVPPGCSHALLRRGVPVACPSGRTRLVTLAL